MDKEFKAGLLEHAEEMGRISMATIPDGELEEVIAFLEGEGYICSISPNTDYLMVEKEENKMTIEKVIENLKKIENEPDIYNEIVAAFDDYEFEGETSVIVSTPSEMNNFTPKEGETHNAYISHEDAPVICFTLEKVDADTWTIVDVW